MFEKAKQEEPLLEGQPNPFENTKFIDLDEDEFTEEVNELIEWSDNLDFDKYTDFWKQLSAADPSGQSNGRSRMTNVPSIIETEFEEVK